MDQLLIKRFFKKEKEYYSATGASLGFQEFRRDY
jgi:hypothetical protein